MKTVDKITNFIALLSAFTLMALVALIVYDATARYMFGAGSVALQELQWHFFDVIIMLGIVYALKEGAHVRVDIFYDKFSKRTKHIIDIATTLLFIVPFSALIIYVSFEFVLMSFEQMEGSSDAGGLPYRFLIKALIPLSFALLVLQAIRQTLLSLTAIRGLK